MSQSRSPVTFGVRYEVEEGLAILSADLLDEEEKLKRRIADVRHPLELNDFLVTVRFPHQTPLQGHFFIWKNRLVRGGPNKSSFRCILQRYQASNHQVVLIARYRGRHERYEQALQRLFAGHMPLVEPRDGAIPAPPRPPSPVRSIRLPMSLRLNSAHTIIECAGVPAELLLTDVMRALAMAGPTTSIDVSGETVEITRDAEERSWIQIPGRGSGPRRSYSIDNQTTDDCWRTITTTRSTPNIDPCLWLSEGERAAVSQFDLKHRLPAFIKGAAGSGKSTILALALASLVVDTQNAGLPTPLYVTLNSELRATAQARLVNHLVIHERWNRERAESVARSTCKTLTQLVAEIIGDESSDADTVILQEFVHFRRWWYGTSRNPHLRGGRRPEPTFRILRRFVFGEYHRDAPTESEIQRILDRYDDLPSGDITHDELHRALKDFVDYASLLRAEQRELHAERVERARSIIMASQAGPNWSYVLCDEAQDITEREFRLLAALSVLCSPTAAMGSCVPMIVAGDEYQCVVPSNFSFAACHEWFEDMAASLGLEVPTPYNEEFQHDFRSARLINEVTNAARRMVDPDSQPSAATRREDGQLAWARKTVSDPATSAWIRDLGVAKIVPCSLEEKASYLQAGGPLEDIFGCSTASAFGADDDWSRGFLTTEECKGMEFPITVICGFGERLLEEGCNDDSWWAHAFHVAVSRARDEVYIADTAQGRRLLTERLRAAGFERALPVRDVAATERQREETLRSQFLLGVRSGDAAMLTAVERELELLPGARSLRAAVQAAVAALTDRQDFDWGPLLRFDGGLHLPALISVIIDRGDIAVLSTLNERLDEASQVLATDHLFAVMISRLLRPSAGLDDLVGVAENLGLTMLELGGATATRRPIPSSLWSIVQRCVLECPTQTRVTEVTRRQWAQVADDLSNVAPGDELITVARVRSMGVEGGQWLRTHRDSVSPDVWQVLWNEFIAYELRVGWLPGALVATHLTEGVSKQEVVYRLFQDPAVIEETLRQLPTMETADNMTAVAVQACVRATADAMVAAIAPILAHFEKRG